MLKIRSWLRRYNQLLGFGVVAISMIINALISMPGFGWLLTGAFFLLVNLHVIPQYWARLFVRTKNFTCQRNYALPFEGKWTVYAGGTTPALSAGWGELITRYTYYFSQVDEAGETNLSPGKNILAAADGTVVKIINQHPDTPKSEEAAADVTGTAHLFGNQIIIRHGKGEYSCTAGLRLNSITVKVGDTVRQGDVIAQCGSSGYMTGEACVQFHLQTGRGFGASASLPVAFTNIHAEPSAAFILAHKKEGVQCPSTDGNLRVVGDKIFIGRGLDVGNIR